MSKNASSVIVMTKLAFTPDGCKRKMKKSKKEFIQFRCGVYEKKLLKKRAQKAGLSLSEFCLRAALDVKIIEILNPKQIEFYKTLIKFSNNFTSIGNMYRKRDPKLTDELYTLANEIKEHLNNFKNDR